jgi:hypothetical protein
MSGGRWGLRGRGEAGAFYSEAIDTAYKFIILKLEIAAYQKKNSCFRFAIDILVEKRV